MIEYELSVNVQVDNEKLLENVLVTVEYIDPMKANVGAIEIIKLELSELKLSKPISDSVNVVGEYEMDSWLAPILLK